ncbi:MAG: type II toxin-antitoxin system HicB family antitoxin, partial [Rhodospirillales bacterium]
MSVPRLPGCRSRGATEREAIENASGAIRASLAVIEQPRQGEQAREIEAARPGDGAEDGLDRLEPMASTLVAPPAREAIRLDAGSDRRVTPKGDRSGGQ